MDIVASLVIPAVVGIGIGIMSGLLGIGGGTVMVPVFRLAFGMSPIMSTATSLFAIIPTSISGAISHARHKTCVPSLGIAAGLGGAVMSPLGVWLAHVSPDWAVMLAAALIIGYSAVNMLGKAIKMGGKQTPCAPLDGDGRGLHRRSRVCLGGSDELPATDEAPDAPEASREARASVAGDEMREAFPRFSRKQLLIGAAIGLGAGLVSGYVGVGGGFIMVPLMLSLLGLPMRLASGTSLIAVMLLAIPGTIEQGLLGNIDYLAGLAVAVGSVPGAVIGARLVRVIPERTLRFLFGGFLIVAAILLAVNEMGIVG